VYIEQWYRWLKSGIIEGETESTVVGAQGKTFSINYLKNKILKEEIESKSQLCKNMKKLNTLLSN